MCECGAAPLAPRVLKANVISPPQMSLVAKGVWLRLLIPSCAAPVPGWGGWSELPFWLTGRINEVEGAILLHLLLTLQSMP